MISTMLHLNATIWHVMKTMLRTLVHSLLTNSLKTPPLAVLEARAQLHAQLVCMFILKQPPALIVPTWQAGMATSTRLLVVHTLNVVTFTTTSPMCPMIPSGPVTRVAPAPPPVPTDPPPPRPSSPMILM